MGNKINRRIFLGGIGAAGLASVFASWRTKSQSAQIRTTNVVRVRPKSGEARPTKAVRVRTQSGEVHTTKAVSERAKSGQVGRTKAVSVSTKSSQAGTTRAASSRAASSRAASSRAAAKSGLAEIPLRKLGKTGVEIPSLGLGTNRLSDDGRIILRKAFESGVTYWDTGPDYTNGNSEHSIGRFISQNRTVREKLFLVTKASRAHGASGLERRLQLSLKRLKTDYIDLYMGMHMLGDPSQLTDELRRWAEKAKKRGMIRFFGFSTHENMARCLKGAAKKDWIDAVMVMYNFRLMQDRNIQAAVEACHKAGIGLVAMKSQAYGLREGSGRRNRYSISTEEDKRLVGHFQKRGYTVGQAKIKVVMQDERISSVCVGMHNTSLMNSNVAAAVDKTKLKRADLTVFKEYAQATCSGYCAGCGAICKSALPEAPYVCDIMRYLMYHNSYGDHETAREHFARIPEHVRGKLARADYRLAEARCPQHLPVSELISEAMEKLT